MNTWWLSFCDPNLPEGSRFQGACIVPGNDLLEAVHNAHLLGCNPGGEVVGVEVPPETAPHIGDKWRHRLLTDEECFEFDREIQTLCPAARRRASEETPS